MTHPTPAEALEALPTVSATQATAALQTLWNAGKFQIGYAVELDRVVRFIEQSAALTVSQEPVAWRWSAPELGEGAHWLSEQKKAVVDGRIAEPLYVHPSLTDNGGALQSVTPAAELREAAEPLFFAIEAVDHLNANGGRSNGKPAKIKDAILGSELRTLGEALRVHLSTPTDGPADGEDAAGLEWRGDSLYFNGRKIGHYWDSKRTDMSVWCALLLGKELDDLIPHRTEAEARSALYAAAVKWLKPGASV